MKNRILVFLVFITNILNAQSVDPETFPTVVGAISGKNLYTNTGGEGKVSIKAIMDSVDILDTATITYADFYTAITGGNLVVGKTYIIMDFQTVYDQMDFDNSGNLKSSLTTKTGAVEEIWVLALANDRIASTAYSKTFPNDRIQYDWTYNATFVNGSPAKGRISERIDEWNNRTDYDHREIKFIRYDDGAGNFTVINDNGNASQEFLTFGNAYATNTGELIFNNYLGDFYSISGLFSGQEYPNNVFLSGFVIDNKIGCLFYNNIITGSEVYGNYFNSECSNNIFLGKVFDNSINSSFINNICYDNFGSCISNSAITDNLFRGSVSFSSFQGNLILNDFNTGISNLTFNGNTNQNIFKSTFGLSRLIINGDIISKTIDDTTYPLLFGGNYEKKLFQAQDGNVYFRYFDGTNDVNTLIP